ncbi:MAG: aldehyde dehydrogenase family protein, partial [Solirubrobacterales bacterium]
MASKDAIRVIEPATEQVMAELPRAGEAETDDAIERAHRAFPGWRAIPPEDRAAMLRGLADAIAERAGEL